MIISPSQQDTGKRKPTRCTPDMSCKGRIAQSVEQGIENPRVGGSIPPPGTIQKSLAYAGLFRVWPVVDENHRLSLYKPK